MGRGSIDLINISCSEEKIRYALNIIVRLVICSCFLGSVTSRGAGERCQGSNQISSSWEQQSVMALLPAHWSLQEILPCLRSEELKDYFSYELSSVTRRLLYYYLLLTC